MYITKYIFTSFLLFACCNNEIELNSIEIEDLKEAGYEELFCNELTSYTGVEKNKHKMFYTEFERVKIVDRNNFGIVARCYMNKGCDFEFLEEEETNIVCQSLLYNDKEDLVMQYNQHQVLIYNIEVIN